jgi:hypothetical protein
MAIKKSKPVPITAEEFDRRFDAGEDISDYIDWESARRPNATRISVDLPKPLLERLDAEADKIGVPRQSLIKVWLAERLGITSAPPIP